MRPFAQMVDELVDDLASLSPEVASFLGLTRYDHESSDLTAAGHARRETVHRRWLEQFRAVDPAPLSPEQVLDRDLVLARLGAAVANAGFESWRRSPEPYILASGVFELFLHGARDEEHAVAAATERLSRAPDTLAAARSNLSPDLASARVVRRHRAAALGQASFLRDDIAGFVTDQRLAATLREAAAPAARALDSFAGFLEELAVTANGDVAFGETRYTTLLQVGEQLPYDASTLHELGRREVASLEDELGEVAARIGGSRDWLTLHRDLQRRHPQDLDELLRVYTETTERARRFLGERDLMTMPEGEMCDVRPAPAFLATVVASYFQSAPFLPGTHGVFNVPFTAAGAASDEVEDRLRSNSNHEIPATTVHETYGGHHAHFVRMANASPLRQFLQSDYFIEGWALYFEKVAHEHGFYRSDEEVLGWLLGRLTRAARIVVDTGFHCGDMTIDDVAAFMHDRAGMPAAVAAGEAERYANWPTQASAYLTGALAIEESRERWMDGGHGSLREFHDAITDSGALPPGLAARAIGLQAPVALR